MLAKSKNSSDVATKKPQPSSGHLDTIRVWQPPRRDRIQSLSEAVAGLLSSTSKLRQEFEGKHRDCVPRAWCDKRMKLALDRADRRYRELLSVHRLALGGMATALTALAAALAALLR